MDMMIGIRSTLAIVALALAFATVQTWPHSSFASWTKNRATTAEYEAGKDAAVAGDYETAVAYLDKAVKLDPTSADAYTILGYSHHKLGDGDAALSSYRIALRLNRMHRGAHRYIGELYLEAGDLANAKDHLNKLGKACTYSCAEYRILKAEIGAYNTAHGG